jgi:septation ring formation regulator EzrA
MTLLNHIEQTITRIEGDIKQIVELRQQHIKTESAYVLSEVDNKINGLRAWLDDIKQAIYADLHKII